MSNRLLELMPDGISSEILKSSIPFGLKAGHSLTFDRLNGRFVFIVTEGVSSKFQRSVDGLHSEIGMIGREGLFPIAGLLGVPASPHLLIAQIEPLRGVQISAMEFASIIKQSGEATLLIRKYVYSFITQISSNMSMSATCAVEARVARWLLMCHDRIVGDEIYLTHDILAQMAFAHRPTVTNALTAIRATGCIEMSRGLIRIVDRVPLISLARGCYGLSEAYWRENLVPLSKDDLGELGKNNRPRGEVLAQS